MNFLDTYTLAELGSEEGVELFEVLVLKTPESGVGVELGNLGTAGTTYNRKHVEVEYE